MRKSLLLIPVCSLVLLAGCSKTVSLDEAKQHVEDNYSQEAADAVYASGTYETVTTISKAEGIFENAGEVGTTKEEGEVGISVLTADSLSNIIDIDGLNFTFKIDGKKLIIEGSANFADVYGASNIPEGAEIGGTVTESSTYNDYGLLESSYAYTNASLSYSVGGVTVSGALEMSVSITYSFVTK